MPLKTVVGFHAVWPEKEKEARREGGRIWCIWLHVFERLGWWGSRFEMRSEMRSPEDRCGVSGSQVRFWLHIQRTFSWSCAPVGGAALRCLSFLLGQKVSPWFWRRGKAGDLLNLRVCQSGKQGFYKLELLHTECGQSWAARFPNPSSRKEE